LILGICKNGWEWSELLHEVTVSKIAGGYVTAAEKGRMQGYVA